MFEQLSLEDTAILLDADKQLIETTRLMGMAELYARVAQTGQAVRTPARNSARACRNADNGLIGALA